ncbi:MAG: hypothetical protein HZB53_12070 [Chloroflexi bacterium]|nr:hypothetical protein [Chloroflexota bacterium]
MDTIETIVRSIQRELTPQFEERLRAYLEEQDKAWLVEQVVRLTLDAHSLLEMDRRAVRARKERQREERIARVRDLALDESKLRAFVARYRSFDRARLVREGFLVPHAPPKGTALLRAEHRTERGRRLLNRAKDTLFALLFGDEATNTRLTRVQRELLTVTLPLNKTVALAFMKATTELGAYGTWQDPESVSNDERADNTLIIVEYGEIAGEWVGHGVVTTLALINNLEVNEQVLYARMENVEESTLIQ